MDGDLRFRGTGRSTGLMLQAISEAILCSGHEAVFKDHHECVTMDSLHLFRDRMRTMCTKLGLRDVDFEIIPFSGCIKVRSGFSKQMYSMRGRV